jgi:hypothetical protein
MSFAFKKFSFFQQHEVKLHGFPANSTCHCLGGSLLYVGCDNGTVHLLDEAFQSQGSLNAYGYKVLFMAWAPVSCNSSLAAVQQFACCFALAHLFLFAASIGVGQLVLTGRIVEAAAAAAG